MFSIPNSVSRKTTILIGLVVYLDAIKKNYAVMAKGPDALKCQFLKEVSGAVRINEGNPFGFIEDVFIHSTLVTKFKLLDGMQFKGKSIKSYNQEKKQWGWKLI